MNALQSVRRTFAQCLLFSIVAWAAVPVMTALAQPAACTAGQGQPCANDNACALNREATLCVGSLGSASCQVPCDDRAGDPDSTQCAMGETCVLSGLPAGGKQAHYCRAAPFSMDLNLLDQCLYHFLEGVVPTTNGTACSLQTSLNALLDSPAPGAQAADGVFDIDDVDRCITRFLRPELCDPVSASCPGGDVYCTKNADCGRGSNCETGIHRCERQCGDIATRDGAGLSTITRPCSGALKLCNVDLGECYQPVDLGTCQVHGDCLTGSYCMLGQCTPNCYRATDCPDSTWTCSKTNRCEPAPLDPDVSQGFDPLSYALSFGSQNIKLDMIGDSYDVPVLIMNLETGAQVFDDPAVVFGYRLEVVDYRKLEDKCLGDLNLLSEENRSDCIVAADEEFITLHSPFGTLYGLGDPIITLSLNHAAAGELSPGDYQATVRAIFDNGGSTTATVRFTNPSPNGDYLGALSIYKGGRHNQLVSSNVAMRLHIDKDAPQVEWDALLTENNVPTGTEFVDVTRGHRVTGYIDGSASMVFAWPGAFSKSTNKVPVRGIYSEQSGRMRLIGVIDLPAEHCRSDSGSGRCQGASSTPLQTRNTFGRDIRRIVHFIGDFDALLNEFEGNYREDVVGMFPSVLTLEGDFRVRQTVQRDDRPTTPEHIVAATIPSSWPSVVDFPSDVDIDEALRVDVQDNCTANGLSLATQAMGHFADQQAFAAYLDDFHLSGRGADGVKDGPVLEQLVTFEDRIQTAINTLGTEGQGALTLADYFKGQIQFCSSTVTSECVDKPTLKCGLALYRTAILKGWVEPLAASPDRSAALFCRIRAGAGQDCPTGATPLTTTRDRALVTYQEHNRFYKELVQTHSYEAAGAISDAFFTLYKASNGDALDANSAFVHKDVNLRKALSAYEQVQRNIFSAPSTRVLTTFPMRAFATRGRSWIHQMHAVMGDRLDALLELLDLRRRVIGSAGTQAEVFVRQVMHQEYLHQVYLMELQSRWEGAGFAYEGQAPRAFHAGELLSAKVSSTRNPAGLHRDRVYFENSSLTSSNWQALRDRVSQRIPAMQQTIAQAIQEMKGALHDKDTLETSLLMTQQEIEAQLDQICGADMDMPAECAAYVADKELLATSCTGPDCDFEFRCGSGPSGCETVRAYFTGNASLSCRADVHAASLTVDVQGGARRCVNGEMGRLLEEQASLADQRKAVVQQVQGLMRSVAREETLIRQAKISNLEYLAFTGATASGILAADITLSAAEATLKSVKAVAEVGYCLPPSLGTGLGNCATSLTAAGAIAAASVGFSVTQQAVLAAKGSLQVAQQLYGLKTSQDDAMRGMENRFANMITEVENLVLSYDSVVQQQLNLELRIADTAYRAQQMANRHAEQIENIVDHLLGRESGSVLVRNRLVQKANAEFRDLLTDVYKMAQAFSYRYNLGPQAIPLQNEVFSIQTVDEVDLFVDRLNDLEHGYCGVEGLDCDSANNWEVFEFSVQKQLFPDLKPLLDADDGTVIRTVGQQFHDKITSSQYLKRRSRASGVRSQIELPVQIWLQDRSGSGNAPQRHMVNPDECNHFLVAGRGGQQGNVAVNVVGTRLRSDKNITYELQRGAIDFVRDCHERTDKGEAELNRYVVGWSPQNTFGQLDNPPSFLTRSSGFTACENAFGLGQPVVPGNLEGCFRYFARDRSLATSDWKVIIPQMDDEQFWLIDKDTPAHERPIIEDIVLYFRYNARPIVSDF